MTGTEWPTLDDVRAAATRSIGPSGRRFWALAASLGLLATWGVAAYAVQLLHGLGTAGYSDRSFWGIYEANLVSFIAVSYGGALVSAILRLTRARWRAPLTRLAEAMAVFSLLVGMAFAVIHLGRPERVWRMLATPQISSPIFWDLVVISTYLLATILFLYLPLIPDLAVLRDRGSAAGWRARVYRRLALNWQGLSEQRRLLERGTTAMAILIIPIAVLVHSVLSWAFALTGRPGWHSTIFAPYFVVGALYSGVAMVILVVAGFRSGYRLERYIGPKHFRYLAYLMLTLNLTYLYFTFTELLTEGYVQNEDAVSVLEALLIGQYAPYFLSFNLVGGLLPFLLIVLPRTRTIAGIVVASVLVVVGMWLKRMLIVVPAVSHPLIAGTWASFQTTWVAVGITMGAAAAIPLLLMLFFKLVPLLSVYEMEEEHTPPEPEPARLDGRGGRVSRQDKESGPMKALRQVAMAVVATAAASLVILSSVHAQAADAPPSSLTIQEPTPSTVRGQLTLRATLATADGRPASNRSVDFYQQVELLGVREAYLGSASTDATGRAMLAYQPAQPGRQHIIARFVAGGDQPPVEASATIEVREVVPPFKEEPLPFAWVRGWLPLGIALLVVATWGLLFGVFFSTVRGIARAGRRA